MTVCSKHFQETDFFLPGPKKLRKLKRRVIPSKYLPVSSMNEAKAIKMLQRNSRHEEITREKQQQDSEECIVGLDYEGIEEKAFYQQKDGVSKCSTPLSDTYSSVKDVILIKISSNTD